MFIHTLIRDEVVWNKQIDKKVDRFVDKRDEVGSEKSSKEQIFVCRNSLYDHHYV